MWRIRNALVTERCAETTINTGKDNSSRNNVYELDPLLFISSKEIKNFNSSLHTLLNFLERNKHLERKAYKSILKKFKRLNNHVVLSNSQPLSTLANSDFFMTQ